MLSTYPWIEDQVIKKLKKKKSICYNECRYSSYRSSKYFEKAVELGEVIVGVLTDNAIASYKRLPVLPYDVRSETVLAIKGVSDVIPQDTLDYTDNLLKIKPDFVVHGDDWKVGIQSKVRNKVIKTISKWNGKLVEPSYTGGISSTSIIESLKEIGTTATNRLSSLKRLINSKDLVRILESRNGLTDHN